MQVSDKETRAVFLNFKELRCLEKNLQVLDIEKAYSISLINLDQKVVKLSNKRLRDKVSKIKSHLPEDQVDELRWLDKMGKLGSYQSASKLNCNVRIAAAEKRLKLQPRAKSAVPRIETARTSATPTPRSLSSRRCSTRLQSARSPVGTDRSNGHKTKHAINDSRSQTSGDDTGNYPIPKFVREERRKSIYLSDNDDMEKLTPREAFGKKRGDSVSTVNNENNDKNKDSKNETKNGTKNETKHEVVTISVEACDNDTPTTNDLDTSRIDQISKPSSPIVSFLDVPRPTSSSSNQIKVRPASVPASRPTAFAEENLLSATSMSNLEDVRKRCAANIRRASRLIASGKTKSPFSCHNIEQEEKPKTKIEKPFRSIRDGVMAEIEKGPMENTLGNNLHREIKRGLMLGEVATSLQLEEKIDTYMEKVQAYVKQNPTAWQPYKPETSQTYYGHAQQSGDPSNISKDNVKQVRNRARKQQLEFKLRASQAQNVFLQNNFADIKKCRYLHIPDSMVDLSGVNTLAVDQMRSLTSMKGGGTY